MTRLKEAHKDVIIYAAKSSLLQNNREFIAKESLRESDGHEQSRPQLTGG